MSEVFEGDWQVRQDFPVTKKTIYMNNGAVAPTPLSTIKAVTDFMLRCAVEGPGAEESELYMHSVLAELRERIAYLINCDRDEIILLQSTTEGLNLIANGVDWKKGDKIVVRGGRHEHFANYLPWVSASKKSGAVIQEVAVDENGFFELADLEREAKNARLITMSHALYNTGSIMPLEEVGKIANENNALFCVDAAQSAGTIEIDVKKIGCHFMAFPGFKWLVGPLGIGALYCSKAASELVNPTSTGGENALLSEKNILAYLEMPAKFQAGFRNYPGAAGLESSLRYVLRIGIQEIRKKNMSVANTLRNEIARIPGAKLYGQENPDLRTSIVSFTLPPIDSSELVKRMAHDGIVLAAREVGPAGKKAVRAAPHFFNTEDEASSVVARLKNVIS